MKKSFIAIITTGLLVSSNTSFAQMDVDDADSLRFQTFHEKKDSSIKLYDGKKGGLKIGSNPEATKIYTDEKTSSPPNATSVTTAPQITTETNAQDTVNKPAVNAMPSGEKGQRFEIRERYAVGFSKATPYTVITVIEPLHQKMSSVCKNGWEIIREFYMPVENDFYKHYEFECL